MTTKDQQFIQISKRVSIVVNERMRDCHVLILYRTSFSVFLGYNTVLCYTKQSLYFLNFKHIFFIERHV